MIGSLQLQYNRGRQAVITTELIDIITVCHSVQLRRAALIYPGCLGFVSGYRCRRDITRKGMQYLIWHALKCANRQGNYRTLEMLTENIGRAVSKGFKVLGYGCMREN
jgi:hypothetical protein